MELTELQKRIIAEHKREWAATFPAPANPNPIIDYSYQLHPLTVGIVLREIPAKLACYKIIGDRMKPCSYVYVAICIMQDIDAVKAELPRFANDPDLQRRLAAAMARLRQKIEPIAMGEYFDVMRLLNPSADDNFPLFSGDFQRAKQLCEDELDAVATDIDAYEMIHGGAAAAKTDGQGGTGALTERAGMNKGEAHQLATEYLKTNPYPGSLRKLADKVGCSHTLLSDCAAVREYIAKREPPAPKASDLSAAVMASSPDESILSDPADRAAFNEDLAAILEQCHTEGEKSRIRDMTEGEQVRLVEAYRRQKDDDIAERGGRARRKKV